MGLWSRLESGISAIGGGLRDIGGRVFEEAREFGGSLFGGVEAGLAGRGEGYVGRRVRAVKREGVGGVPEAFGALIGTVAGGALKQRAEGIFKKEEARTRSPEGRATGTAGTSPSSTTPTSFSWAQPARSTPEAEDVTFGGMGGTDMPVSSALPGGAPVQRAGMGLEQVLGPLIGGGIDWARRQFGGETVANGGALTLPGAAPGSLYRIVGPALRARSLVAQQHPTTGDIVYWRYVGKAKSFAGDRRIAKGYAKEHGMRLCRSGRSKR